MPDGSALLLTLAGPRREGGALYVITGSYRGIRRLVLVRKQLLELVVYEVVLALPLVGLFAFGLVRPLEKLSAAARRYPAAPLADPTLYARRDEIGALARTLTDMAEDSTAGGAPPPSWARTSRTSSRTRSRPSRRRRSCW